jgi:DNA anti-recombination protein RmuC
MSKKYSDNAVGCMTSYDKFVLFVEEFQKIGVNLNLASASFKNSMDRLKEGHRKGDTILGKFENIKNLEAKTNKNLPPQLLKELEILDDKTITIELPEGDSAIVDTNLG